MSLREELPVEPLSEEQWDRVEEAVFAELDSPSASLPPARTAGRESRWRLGAAVGLGLAVAAAAIVAWTVGDEATTAPNPSSSRIVTQGDATRVELGEVTLDVAPHTTVLTTGSDADGWLLTLQGGEVRASVPARAARPSFVVRAASVRVEVVGTVFSVSRDDGAVGVRVEEGAVTVTNEGQALRLREGESWRSAPEATARNVGSPTERLPPADAVEAAPTGDRESMEDSRGEPPPEQLGSRVLFQRAQRLEATAPERALRLYRQAARGSDGWAANALYAWGRLEIDLGHRDRGAATLRRYLERFPEGHNAADARELLARLGEAPR